VAGNLLPRSNDLKLSGVYSCVESKFSVFELTESAPFIEDKNSSTIVIQNKNLLLVSKQKVEVSIERIFLSLKPPLTIHDAGIFIYPLGACFLLAVFVLVERLFSLRRSLTFPRKVEKALRSGEFPNKKWKQYSAAERIVWVAVHEKPSPESLRSYAKLEVSALERGLYILEVVVAGAPLIGLLGTVTGLVQVFSVMPSLAEGKDALSEGIGLALFTTILGLAIAIPTLIGHSYLSRLIDKRTVSLNWVTARINDAIHPKQDDVIH
jgi:biopolymer transport protein ExbB